MVSAFPNPTSSALTLDLGATTLDLNVAILDAPGRSVHTAQWIGLMTGQRQVDLICLAPGYCTPRLTDGQGQCRLSVRCH